MQYEIKCKNDCMHRAGGVCGLNIAVKNSLFPEEKVPCIYYAKKIPKHEKDLFPSPTF